jgi:hypothetical protein
MFKYVGRNLPPFLRAEASLLEEKLKIKLGLQTDLSSASIKFNNARKVGARIVQSAYDTSKPLQENANRINGVVEDQYKVEESVVIKGVKKELGIIENAVKVLPSKQVEQIDRIITSLREAHNDSHNDTHNESLLSTITLLENEKAELQKTCEALDETKQSITQNCAMANGTHKELNTLDKYVKQYNINRDNLILQKYGEIELFSVGDFVFVLTSIVDAVDTSRDEVLEIKTSTTQRNALVAWPNEEIQLWFYLYSFGKPRGKIVKSYLGFEEVRVFEYQRSDIIGKCEGMIADLRAKIESWF